MKFTVEIRPSNKDGNWFVKVGSSAMVLPNRERAIRYLTKCIRNLLAEKQKP